MKIGLNCGHTLSGAGYGAVGIIKESEHTRLVGHALREKLNSAGVEVIDCTIDQANTQNEYLAAAVALANRQDLDWFVSIHFNASSAHNGQGVEVYTYEGRQYQDALDVCQNISELGFKNRGVKSGTGLYVIRKTKAKSMLIEVCFCDNEHDVSTYLACGEEKIAQAIFNGLVDYVAPPESNKTENHNMTKEEFIEFAGEIASEDWKSRKIMLPSVVIAQAMKESGCGTSELAQNANAIFGIKQNGWTGKIYYKDAIEQNADGSYRKDTSVAWRAYGNWEESIIDHNTYIATRKVGSQTEPNWGKVVGETNYVLVAQHLQDAQFPYATSQNYVESLINDYIEKYNLNRFDEVEEEKTSDGSVWVCSIADMPDQKSAEAWAEKFSQMKIDVNVHHVKLI